MFAREKQAHNSLRCTKPSTRNKQQEERTSFSTTPRNNQQEERTSFSNTPPLNKGRPSTSLTVKKKAREEAFSIAPPLSSGQTDQQEERTSSSITPPLSSGQTDQQKERTLSSITPPILEPSRPHSKPLAVENQVQSPWTWARSFTMKASSWAHDTMCWNREHTVLNSSCPRHRQKNFWGCCSAIPESHGASQRVVVFETQFLRGRQIGPSSSTNNDDYKAVFLHGKIKTRWKKCDNQHNALSVVQLELEYNSRIWIQNEQIYAKHYGWWIVQYRWWICDSCYSNFIYGCINRNK